MNKRRFNDQYAHIVSASKHHRGGMGSRFRLQEVSLTLTPDNDLSAEHPSGKVQQNEPTGSQLDK